MHGYAQNLWLHGPEHFLTEVGTMNLFVVLQHDPYTYELVTPPLDGMILPGVTRDSVLALAKENGRHHLEDLKDTCIIVSERAITMNEIKKASESGKLVEMFGSGNVPFLLRSLDHIPNRDTQARQPS